MFYYSQTTGGFYTREIHGENMPLDVQEITAREHATLMDGQAGGKRIVSDGSGRPVLQDPPPPVPEESDRIARSKRAALLASSDWVALRALEAGTAIPPNWSAYRQALRDIQALPGYPHDIVWPKPPSA